MPSEPTGAAAQETPEDAASLLPLALSQPQESLAIARSVLQQGRGSEVDSYAHQAVGIVLRDAGRVAEALRELRAALRCAGATGSAERRGDVLATYGATLALAGRSREGLVALDEAVSLTRGVALARVRLRRAHVLVVLGRYPDALADLRLAIPVLRRHGDVLWEARSLNNRCLVHLALGAYHRAAADAARAELLLTALGQQLESVHAVHNQALVELARGDLPAALARLDQAGERYRRLDVPMPELEIDRVRTLLAAGLAVEAVAVTDEALAGRDVQPTKRAELLLAAATACLAAGRPELAAARAQDAARLFSRQGRPAWELRARLAAAQARHAAGQTDARLLAGVLDLAGTLTLLEVEEAPQAHLLAGRIALARDDRERALEALVAAARHRRHGSPLSRASSWLALALSASLQTRSRQLLAACGHGLDALDEHRLFFGAELRATATQHGRELAALALSESLRQGRSRGMLWWSERWRATAVTVPSVSPPVDAGLAGELAAYREVVRRLQEASGAGRDTRSLVHERDERESAVRRRRRHQRELAGAGAAFDLAELLDRLGSSRLVSLVEVRDELHAVTVQHGRVRRTLVGPMAAARRELDFARFALRRIALGRSADLDAVGAGLERVLLGAASSSRGAEPVVLVPPSSLHHVPGACCPVCGRCRSPSRPRRPAGCGPAADRPRPLGTWPWWWALAWPAGTPRPGRWAGCTSRSRC